MTGFAEKFIVQTPMITGTSHPNLAFFSLFSLFTFLEEDCLINRDNCTADEMQYGSGFQKNKVSGFNECGGHF